MFAFSPIMGVRGLQTWGCKTQYFNISKRVSQKAAMLQESWQQYVLQPFLF